MNEKFLRASAQLCCSFLPCTLAARAAQEGKGIQHGQRSQAGVRTYGGLSHFLCLKRTPVPQVRLHMLHWLHTLQSPSTCSGMGVLLTHSPARHHCKAIKVNTAWEEALTLHKWTLKDCNKPTFKFLEIRGFGEMGVGEGGGEEVKCKNLSVALNKPLKGVLSLKKTITEQSPLLYKADNYLRTKT